MPKSKTSKGYSDEDLAEVSNNPEWTQEDFSHAKPFAEVFPGLAESIRRSRGPQKAPTKVAVSIRLSQDVLSYYKSQGDKWQSRIDQDLRKIVSRKRS